MHHLFCDTTEDHLLFLMIFHHHYLSTISLVSFPQGLWLALTFHASSMLRPMDYLHCLVLIFPHHVYHRTILTGLWLPYWTYTLSRYLAAASCSHTFLSRMMFTWSHDPHCPVSLTPLYTISCARESVRLLYLQTLLLLTIHMTAHLSAHYWAAVPTPSAYTSQVVNPIVSQQCYRVVTTTLREVCA